MTATENEKIPAQEAAIPRENDDANGSVDDGSVCNGPTEPGPFALQVDPDQKYRAKECKFWKFSRPHMRAFHYAWMAPSMAMFMIFGIAPILPEIQLSLDLTSQQIWLTNTVGMCGDIFCRIVLGSLTDRHGPRFLSGAVLLATCIPVACIGVTNSLAGLCILRMFTSCAGSTMVMSSYWMNKMFVSEIVGTVSAVTGGIGCGTAGLSQVVMGSLMFPLFRDVVYGGEPDAADKSWRIIFVIPATVAFFLGAAVIKTSDDTPLGDYTTLIKQGSMQSISSLTSLQQGGKDRNTWLLFFQYACSCGAEFTMLNGATTYFVDEFDLSISSAAAISSILGLAAIFARTIGGYVSDKLNEKIGMKGRIWAQLIFLLAEGVSIIVFAAMNSLWSAILLLTAFAVADMAAQGSTYGIVPFVNDYVGGVGGIVGAGGSTGAILFGLGFMFLPETKHAFYFMGGIVILGSASCLLFNLKEHGGLLFTAEAPEAVGPSPDELNELEGGSIDYEENEY